ncbi:MAG: hypothetical protein ACK5O7_02715 [Holosporales bacterium]
MPAPVVTAALTLAELAPVIARWFSDGNTETPSGQRIASKVIDLAKQISGSHDAISAAKILQNDPKLLIEFQMMILKMDQEMEVAYLRDRADARARDAALASAGRQNIRADIMVTCAALGLVACLISLGVYQENLPGEAVGIISTIAGIFGACLKDAYAFEFGSSRGSKAKDMTMLLTAGR